MTAMLFLYGSQVSQNVQGYPQQCSAHSELTALVVISAEWAIHQLNKHSAFGKEHEEDFMFAVSSVLNSFWWDLMKNTKFPFPWRQLTIPSQGKLPQSQDETVDRQRHRKPRIPLHRRFLRRHTTGEQSSHRCGRDSWTFSRSRPGFGKAYHKSESLWELPGWKAKLCKTEYIWF